MYILAFPRQWVTSVNRVNRWLFEDYIVLWDDCK